MYTAVLMLALTAGSETADHGRRSCRGCSSGCAASYHGCSGTVHRSGYYGYNSEPRMFYSGGTAYYYPNGGAQLPQADLRQSFYFEPGQAPAAMIRILVPTPDAEIWFDNASTNQRGLDRMFISPSLEPGNYTYTIKARWMDNGRAVDQERRVEIRPDQPVTVDFRANGPETLPNPKGPGPKALPKNNQK